MSRVIVTSHEGEEFDEIAAITMPLITAYAERHGVDHIDVTPPGFVKRPASWKKLIAICDAFTDHDEVLWIDTDVVVVNGEDNIFDAASKSPAQAMVRHATVDGDVPNAGVWFLRRSMLPVLMSIAMVDVAVNHRWWEQAALLSVMGFVESEGRCSHQHITTLYQDTVWLDESWNFCRESPAGVPPRFLHACGMGGIERIEAIRGWANAAT